MEHMTIGFSKPKKFKPFAWLIMKAYGIPYSHVYVSFYSEKFNRSIIYQASHTMVNCIGLMEFIKENEIVKEFNVSIEDSQRTQAIQFAIDNLGKSYSIRGVIGLGIVRVFELLNKKIENPFKDGEQMWFCCEFATKVLQQFSGTQIDTDSESISPKELYNILIKE